MKKSFKAVGVGGAVVSLALPAGWAGDSPTQTATAEPTETSAALSPEAQAAADLVATISQSTDEFVPPGPAVDGSALEGKTVYFIPATLQVPLLNVVGQGVTEALSNVGADVQICDAKANPADAASCINQAIDARAAAVVTTGMTPDFAPTAFDALLAAGIPWVQGLTAPAGDGDPAQVAYVTPNIVLMQSWATNWVIADSDAQANVLVIKLTDTPATTMWADLGILATYEQACTECDVEVIEINAGQTDRLPSLISSALLANPDITYIQSQFDQFLPAVTQGVQSAARDDIKINSVDGYLSTLQDIAAGGNVKSVVAFNPTALAWYMADAAVRLGSGAEAAVGSDFPFRRMFTGENVDELTITADAQATGEWFGEADYKAGFLELWGAD